MEPKLINTVCVFMSLYLSVKIQNQFADFRVLLYEFCVTEAHVNSQICNFLQSRCNSKIVHVRHDEAKETLAPHTLAYFCSVQQ